MRDVTTKPIAIEADLLLSAASDWAAPGAVITTALCGHWEHEGRCRWPHNSRIDTSVSPTVLRMLVIVDNATQNEVVALVERGLRDDGRWQVMGFRVGAITDSERALGDRLNNTDA